MKTAIISGASRGIGKAIANTLAEAGMHVVLLARSYKDLQDVVQGITARGFRASAFELDILNENNLKIALETVINQGHTIDVLVNNAGVGKFKSITNTSTQEWDEVMDTNVKGTFLLTQAILPYMQAQKSGHIITIASDVARRTFANGALYCASKYAQDAFTLALRQEVHAYNIKVSTVYPGLTDTYFNNQTPSLEINYDKLQANDIAEAVKYIYNAPAHVVVDELVLHPLSQQYW